MRIMILLYVLIHDGWDAVRDAAELYRIRSLAIIDDASNADLDNVTCMMFEQEHGLPT